MEPVSANKTVPSDAIHLYLLQKTAAAAVYSQKALEKYLEVWYTIYGNSCKTNGLQNSQRSTPQRLPEYQISPSGASRPAEKEDLHEIQPSVSAFCDVFGYDSRKIFNAPFTVVTPDSKNPYKQMYAAN